MSALGVVPKDLRVKLVAVISAAGEQATDIRAGVEDWYERNMTAASMWYRKQTRYFLFLAGLVMAISLNVDAVHAADTLYHDDSTRAAVVALADQISQIDCPSKAETSEDAQPAESSTAIDLDCVRSQVGGSVSLPVGWDGVDTSPTGWLVRALGWIIIAASVTMGAPFWYDLLSRALKLRQKKGNDNDQ